MFLFPFFDGSLLYHSAIPQLIGCIKSFLGKIIRQQMRDFHLLSLINISHHIDNLSLKLI